MTAATRQAVGPGRVTSNLMALYEFEEAGGSLLHDTSFAGTPLDLQIETPSEVLWQPGALLFTGDSTVASPGPALKVNQACALSGEVTIEAWITPSNVNQSGPARVVSVSDGSLNRNVTLGHGGYGSQPPTAYNVRTRTTGTDDNGTPELITSANAVVSGLQHVVYTRDAGGSATTYVDGVVHASGSVGGNLSNWDAGYRLGLGNEIGASRPWYGSMHLVAVYDRALTSAEVAQNLAAGSGDPPLGGISVTPASDFAVFGVVGGDLSAQYKTYDVLNSGNAPVSWSVQSSMPWAYIEGPSSGSLLPGVSQSVTVRLHGPTVAALSAGSHTSVLQWTNLTNGLGSIVLHAEATLSDPGTPSGKPGPGNTGPSIPGILVPSGSITANVNGQVIENVDISGVIVINASNVTIRNFRINANGASYGILATNSAYSGTVIEDGEIYNVDSAGIFGKNFTARQLNIHHGGGDAIKSRGDVLVENCWIHHLGMNPGAHADGNQTRIGNNIVFRHNNIDMPVSTSPNGEVGFLSNATFMLHEGLGQIHNFVIEDNWLNGGNYTLMIDGEGGGPTGLVVVGNRFGRDYRYGSAIFDGVSYIASGNVWEDTGESLSWNNQ